jgi:hypothetical protein
MKLAARFVQLPVQFDAERLAHEINALPQSAWRPHPQGFAGNDFLPLVSAKGEPANESFADPMRPTEFLQHCPYLIDTLATIGASLGRTRLMRLSGHAEVTVHFDAHYYWRERMRVHVPIVTQPTVRFICGDEEVNMKPGECWIFDTWSNHRVINDAVQSRVHLVVDTVGGEGFWDLAVRGRNPRMPAPAGWSARAVAPIGARVSDLDYETANVPRVMSPWEVRENINFLLGDVLPNQPALGPTAQAAGHFIHVWRGLWSTYGDSAEGLPRYRRALEEFVRRLQQARADTVRLPNDGDLYSLIGAHVISMALAGSAKPDLGGERRDAGAHARTPSVSSGSARDPVFDRPVFIVNPPRSGSSLLFETLAMAPGLYTIGGESHGLIEGVPALSIAAKQGASNRLDRSDATPEVVEELRRRFFSALRDREGARPPASLPIRMLEKTPKNALRVPFLAAVFPEARFIYLHRDPREVFASMIEGWESGGFRTYKNLPGWEGDLPWSFLLTPGWRDLAQLPLNERVAAQWATTTQILLDDLNALPDDRWLVSRYDALLADPSAEVRRICEAVGFDWDVRLGQELPLSAHTVSRPRREKWRERGAAVESVLPMLSALLERVERVAAR